VLIYLYSLFAVGLSVDKMEIFINAELHKWPPEELASSNVSCPVGRATAWRWYVVFSLGPFKAFF
jgi:hypothetical protein